MKNRKYPYRTEAYERLLRGFINRQKLIALKTPSLHVKHKGARSELLAQLDIGKHRKA